MVDVEALRQASYVPNCDHTQDEDVPIEKIVKAADTLELMQSLPPNLQAKVQTYKLMKDPAMPRGRWNHDDQRHLCGAYRDNRVIPYEGILVSQLSGPQQDLVIQILQQHLLYLPLKSRQAMLHTFFAETHFSRIHITFAFNRLSLSWSLTTI